MCLEVFLKEKSAQKSTKNVLLINNITSLWRFQWAASNVKNLRFFEHAYIPVRRPMQFYFRQYQHELWNWLHLSPHKHKNRIHAFGSARFSCQEPSLGTLRDNHLGGFFLNKTGQQKTKQNITKKNNSELSDRSSTVYSLFVRLT